MRQLDTVICHILYEAATPCLQIIGQLNDGLRSEIDAYLEKSLRIFDVNEDSA